MTEKRNMMDRFVQICEQAAADGLLHGAVVAAGDRRGLRFSRAWGDAAVAPARAPMAEDAVFDMASVTKAVGTASACGICIDRGLLDPDAPATEYLPGIGSFADEPIRVRELATHTSGFDNRKFDALEPEAMLAAMIETPAQWRPGTAFAYSCRNYVVLGLLVERLAGTGLAPLLEGDVFGPCGMGETRFGPLPGSPDRVVPTCLAPGVISDEQARRANRPVGNAGIFSTAADLARFCGMLLNDGLADGRRVLGPDSLRWLLSACSPAGLPPRSFGWDMRPVEDSPCRPRRMSAAAIGHSGWTGQSVWIDPEPGVFTIVLTNRTHQPGRKDNYQDSKRFRSAAADVALADFRG